MFHHRFKMGPVTYLVYGFILLRANDKYEYASVDIGFTVAVDAADITALVTLS